MTEISFWSYVKNDDSAEIIVQNLELLMQTFYNKDEYEVIIINPALGESALSTINGFEREHSQNVMLVNCDGIMQDEAFDVMLEYANGQCFMQIDEGFELNSKTFEKLLYDAAICDEDTFKYIRDKYTYIALGRDSSEFMFLPQYEKKCLSDYRENAGSIDLHYFYQDIYAASRVKELGIEHIYDIGSRVDGYISHLLSMGIRVTMIDIRPLDHGIEGLDFIQGNALELAG